MCVSLKLQTSKAKLLEFLSGFVVKYGKKLLPYVVDIKVCWFVYGK